MTLGKMDLFTCVLRIWVSFPGKAKGQQDYGQQASAVLRGFGVFEGVFERVSERVSERTAEDL